MLNYIKYRYELSKLQKERRNVLAKSPHPVEGEKYEPDFSVEAERNVAEHRIYRLVSDRYYEKAFQYGVSVPRGDKYWDESEAYPGTSHLNREGLGQLRSAIHEEQKRRLEHFSVLVAGLTGLVGAATGLIAVIATKG